ncbi:MAG TPA: TIGR00730 family Rossman fold protein [Urbifossiella sp.]|jgi:hypothetical protein|nr:TIGR00730 family Rossman fold protein [Urbifossiella sp.]
MKSVCVFCGSATGADPAFAAAARAVGTELARRALGLVYGGGRVGLMGQVATATLAAGGTVVGVIPHALSGKEIAFTEATELIVVESMHARKALMADRADAFVALPGGFGTFDELFEILTWAQLGIHRKPIGLLNVAGFFTPLLAWLDQVVAAGLLKPKHRGLLLASDSVPDLLDQLASFTPPPAVSKLDDPPPSP